MCAGFCRIIFADFCRIMIADFFYYVGGKIKRGPGETPPRKRGGEKEVWGGEEKERGGVWKKGGRPQKKGGYLSFSYLNKKKAFQNVFPCFFFICQSEYIL